MIQRSDHVEIQSLDVKNHRRTRSAAAPEHPPPRILTYRDGTLREDLPFEAVDGEVGQEGGLVWLDLDNPSEEQIQHLQEELSIHPLAVLDIQTPRQRPKMDEYEKLTLVVLFAGESVARHRIQLKQVAMFVGPGYLVTIHNGPIPALEDVRARWLANPKLVDPNPCGMLLYKLCAALVDGSFPIVDAFDRRIETIEDRLFRRLSREMLQNILLVRRDLVELRRVIGPQRDVFTALARHEDPVIGQAVAPYFTDLVDLTLRLTETIDTMRDRLGTALESYLTLQSNALNDTMKRLTALTVMLTLPMIVSGIYGMNFEYMPELQWTHGYLFAWVVILTSMGVAFLLFRHNDWL